MAIKYRFSKRRNPAKPTEMVHLMQAVSTGTVDLDQISYEISNECSLTDTDVQFVLHALAKKMKYHLSDGKIVDLEFLGRYKVGMKCTGQPSQELLKVKGVKKFHLNFQPSVKLKHWLKKGISLRKEPSKK